MKEFYITLKLTILALIAFMFVVYYFWNKNTEDKFDYCYEAIQAQENTIKNLAQENTIKNLNTKFDLHRHYPNGNIYERTSR